MALSFRLCYISDRKALEPHALLPRIQGAIRAGVDLIQIREKDLTTRELMALVAPAVEAARGTSTRVVVNDRLDVALALGAAGVHLGTQSLPAAAVRQIVPQDFLIGVSCHSLEEAQAAGPRAPTTSSSARFLRQLRNFNMDRHWVWKPCARLRPKSELRFLRWAASPSRV